MMSFTRLLMMPIFVVTVTERAGLDERDDFLAEIAMMKRVGRHENIVVMLACVTLNQPYSMVLEYVPYGDLLHYLRTLRAVYHQSKGSHILLTTLAICNSSLLLFIIIISGLVTNRSQSHQTEFSNVGGSNSSVALLPKKSANTHSSSDGSKTYNLSHIFSSFSSQSTGYLS